MYLIFNAHSSNAHCNADCDYAVVELTPALAKRIRNRVALVRQAGRKDRDLWELHFWGGTAEFFDHKILDACQNAVVAAGGPDPDQAARDWLDEFEQQEYAVVPDGVNLDAHEAQRTETDQMIIQCSRYPRRLEFSVLWTASPKHADLDITTSELPLAAMNRLLAAHR